MAYSCCFSLGGNLEFLEFLQKKFYNINFQTQTNSAADCVNAVIEIFLFLCNAQLSSSVKCSSWCEWAYLIFRFMAFNTKCENILYRFLQFGLAYYHNVQFGSATLTFKMLRYGKYCKNAEKYSTYLRTVEVLAVLPNNCNENP